MTEAEITQITNVLTTVVKQELEARRQHMMDALLDELKRHIRTGVDNDIRMQVERLVVQEIEKRVYVNIGLHPAGA